MSDILNTLVLLVCVPIAVTCCLIQYKMKKAGRAAANGAWRIAQYQVPLNFGDPSGPKVSLGKAVFFGVLKGLAEASRKR